MIGALAAVPYVYRRLDETVRARVETLFATHYRDLRVTVHSAALADGGIQVRGVSIEDPKADGPRAELLYIEELFLVCKTDLATLLSTTPEIVEVTARRPLLRATRRADGSWSASRLFPLPTLGREPPTISIEGATVELFDPLEKTPRSLALRDGYFKVAPHSGGPLPAGERRPLGITGYCTADSIRRIELAGTFNPTGGAWEVSGLADGLEITPELLHDLPCECPQGLNLLEALRGQVHGKFAVRYDGAKPDPWTYEVIGQLSRGRLDDSRLPHPLTELRAGFHVNAHGFAIQNLTANSGPAMLTLDIRREGFGENAPMTVVAKATQLKLDRQLSAILPTSWQEMWQQSLPAGELDLDATLRYDGIQWTPDVVATCHDVALTYPKFPYRLEHGSGRVILKDNVLTVEDMTAYSGGEQIRLRAEIHQPGPEWTGFFTADSRNLPVDQKLIKALPPTSREIVENLNPNGSFGLFVHYWRQAGAPVHSHLSINLNGCYLRYKLFPYPLHNVRGVVEANDQTWTFDDLHGTNDSGLVRCHGEMKPGPDGNQLVLHFAGQNVPLEDELRDALRPSARQLWNEINPTGAVDLSVKVEHRTSWREPSIVVTAAPVKDIVAIQPRYFPYRLEKLSGEFDYENGRVVLKQLAAEHGANTRLTARGHCEVDASGGWRLHLEDMHCGRLIPDRELVQALPARLRKAITEMQLSGPATISGRFDLGSTGKPEEPLWAGWDIVCDLQQVRMAYSLPLENINGQLSLSGSFDGRQFRSRGELNLDSLTYKDFQFTEIRGPLWLDDTRMLLGGTVPAPPGKPARAITSRCCGGTILSDGWVAFGPNSHYNFDAVVVNAQLARAAQEVLAGRQKLSGELSARVNVRGQGSNTTLLAGGGHVELRNADIYQLPAMVSLLKILSMRVPDAHAFSKSDIDFRLEGGHIYFDRINFNGDAISLRGTGEMGLDKNLQLMFYTVVGRDQWRVPLVSDVLGGASQQLMAIYVNGPLDHPEIRKQALPAVNEAFQEIQAELQGMRAATAAAPTDAGPPANRGLPPQRR